MRGGQAHCVNKTEFNKENFHGERVTGITKNLI